MVEPTDQAVRQETANERKRLLLLLQSLICLFTYTFARIGAPLYAGLEVIVHRLLTLGTVALHIGGEHLDFPPALRAGLQLQGWCTDVCSPGTLVKHLLPT